MTTRPNHRRPVATSLAILSTVATLGLGCPDGSETSRVVETCREVGQQCRLGGGQLGVCLRGEDDKLECASQH